MALHPVILAGGSGTRLWPLSREYYPKQFLSLSGKLSLFQESFSRLEGAYDVAPPLVVCNEEHRFLVVEQARQIGKPLTSIILEPVGRNTAPALTLAALTLVDGCDESATAEPVMLVMPADHIIRDVSTFQSMVLQGVELAEQGCLVTFGIVPTANKTGYGYIKKGQVVELVQEKRVASCGAGTKYSGEPISALRLEGFVEKPDQATVTKMLESQDYFWNSGIFIMKVSVWLEQLERYRPDIIQACRAAHSHGERDGDFYRPDPRLFATCASDSIDYAVMEKMGQLSAIEESPSSPECVVLPLDAGWSDVGEWTALWEKESHDTQGNVIQGDVYAQSMTNSMLIGQHRLLAAVGLDNLIVVETADAVLVARRDCIEEVKGLVARLKEDDRPEQENHRKVSRPWGTYQTVDIGPGFQVKRLTVNPGAALSLQMHHHRAEHWVVVKGTAKVTRDDESFLLTENQSTYVPVGTAHRLENPGTIPLEIIEVQSGRYLGEDDILRFDDRYNRHKNRKSSRQQDS